MNTNDERPKPKVNWSSLVSLAFFVIVVIGRPLAQLLARAATSLNLGWADLLPFVLGVVILACVVAALARVSGAGRAAPRLPTSMPSAYLPPKPESIPQPPRFEPILSPSVLVVGALGLAALGFTALLVLFQASP